ncbi:MAG TPA: cytochrome c [Gammaproteobacteria bacterium]
MNKMQCRLALICGLLLLGGAARAQDSSELVGDPHAGRYHWQQLATTSCKNCHGINGQGGFAPALAGRGLTAQDFINAIRNPLLMAEFPQLDDQLMADFAAWFATLPPVQEVAPWRFAIPADAAPGLRTAFAIGCAQCHGPELETPRHNAGAVGGDFEWFKDHVYNHTATVRPHWNALELPNPPPFVRMGNYSPERLPESVLEQVWGWMTDEGLLTPLTAGLAGPRPGAREATYTLTVINRGLEGKGLVAEDVTIALMIPSNSRVVSATGDGYVGVEEFEGENAAVWRVSRIAPPANLEYRLTLAQPPTVLDNIRANLRWSGGKHPEALNNVGVGRRPRSFP